MVAIVRKVLGACCLLGPVRCSGLYDSAVLVQETLHRQPVELLKQAEEVLETVGPLQMHQRPTVADKENLMTAKVLMKSPALLKLYAKKPAKANVSDSSKASSPSSAAAAVAGKSTSSHVVQKHHAHKVADSAEASASSSSGKHKVADSVEASASSSSGRHKAATSTEASSSSASVKHKAASSAGASSSSSPVKKIKHKVTSSSEATTSHSSQSHSATHRRTNSSHKVASSSEGTTSHSSQSHSATHRHTNSSHKVAHSGSGSSTSTAHSASPGLHRETEVEGKAAQATVKMTRHKHHSRSGSCSSSDKEIMEAMGAGSAKGSFPAAPATCGKKAFSLSGVDEAKFLNCFTAEAKGISEPCGKCFVGAAIYGVKNCAVKCMMSWCSEGCLACAQEYRDGPLKECVGFDTPEASAC